MRTPFLLLPLSLSVFGCSRAPIEDGREIGPLVQVKDSFTSVFLLDVGDGTAALFDAGFQSSGRRIEKALEARNLGRDDVAHIFVSHGHTDHLGGLTVFENAAVHAHADERALLAEADLGGRSIDVVHREGDVVPLGEYTVEVFHVPGHTAGSTVYLVGGVLVMGDVVIAQKDGTLAPPSEGFSDDPAENDASVRALAERLAPRRDEVAWIAPHHSAPLKGFGPLADF